MTDITQLAARLQAWARQQYGSDARVDGVRSLGGHSGVTIGFDVALPQRPTEALVLKIPPAGVNRKNNFDVLRQVPLLHVLERRAILAPRLRFHSDDESAFGAPYLVMTRLRGAPLPDVFGPDAGRGVVHAERLFEQAIDTLAAIHAIDADADLGDWNVIRRAPEEIDHWPQVLRKSSDAEWVRQGMAVHDALHRTMPRAIPTGLVHGDYYTNNWIFDEGRLTGVVDWEGASRGPILLDLGWLCNMYDAEAWGPTRRRTMHWHPGPEAFLRAYAARSSLDLSDLDWYRALGGYRLACITAYYYELHRSGKRPNPAWDVMGESVPYLFARAGALLAARAAG